LSNIPDNVKNPVLYDDYLKLLTKVIAENQLLLDDIWKLKNSRATFESYPNLKFMTQKTTPEYLGIYNSFADEIWTTEEISLKRIVDYLVDGLYHDLIVLNEYNECVKLMSSDKVIGKQINKSLSLAVSHMHMSPWLYLSHFLKSTLFDYLLKHQMDPENFNVYFVNLESFFYEEYVDYKDISPLHHFQIVGALLDGNLKNIQCSIILSESLHITPLKHEQKLNTL